MWQKQQKPRRIILWLLIGSTVNQANESRIGEQKEREYYYPERDKKNNNETKQRKECFRHFTLTGDGGLRSNQWEKKTLQRAYWWLCVISNRVNSAYSFITKLRDHRISNFIVIVLLIYWAMARAGVWRIWIEDAARCINFVHIIFSLFVLENGIRQT